jgi:hypothetical protein
MHVGSGDVEVDLLTPVMDVGYFVGQHRATGLHLVTDLWQGWWLSGGRLGGRFLAGFSHELSAYSRESGGILTKWAVMTTTDG